MSSSEKGKGLPKKGNVLHRQKQAVPEKKYAHSIAVALRAELGSTHGAVKVVMRWTGAGERTVKHWLAGTCGPSGSHLISLLGHSDQVLQTVLDGAGRSEALAPQQLLVLQGVLADTVAVIEKVLRR